MMYVSLNGVVSSNGCGTNGFGLVSIHFSAIILHHSISKYFLLNKLKHEYIFDQSK